MENSIDKNKLLTKYTRHSLIRYKHEGFVIIPHSLLFNTKIGNCARMVFWVLTMHMFKGKEYCFPSLLKLQEETQLSRNTVLKGIRQLKLAGYLEVEGDKKTGKVNKYYLKIKI